MTFLVRLLQFVKNYTKLVKKINSNAQPAICKPGSNQFKSKCKMQVANISMVQNKAHNAPNTALVYQSDQLFQGQKEIIIQHEDASYRLRITRQGKLILNK